MLNSMGWIFVIIALIFTIVKQSPGFLIIAAFGAGMIWLQLRGGRIQVDMGKKVVRSGRSKHVITNPFQIFINEVRVTQNVNSRAQSMNAKTVFYKAYLLDGEDKVLLSSNRNEERDMAKLKAIADELRVELVKNY